ncbi:MAG: zinc ABC transporter substrate-binding protein [Patescibacteria group bacterium]|jgi:zinc transport system substrate-binding protein
MKKKITIGIIIACCIGVFIWITVDQTSPADTDGLQVTASFYPLYYFTQQIGGDKVSVANITPAGVEPHDYEPTAKDVARIENSRLLIVNGGGLEAWLENVRQNITPGQTTIVTAGEGLPMQEVAEGGETISDPHVWLSPVLARHMVDVIASALTEADPSNGDYYGTNAQALQNRLIALDTEYHRGLRSCTRRTFVTAHAAFHYLAVTYNLEQLAITGISPESEPSPQELASIAEFAREHAVGYIFFEELVSPKLSETVAHEVGAQTLVLNPLEGLTSQDIADGKDYFTEMKSNLTNLQTALECQTP